MTAKEYLSQAIYLDERINSKIVQIENLRGLTNRITTVYSDMPSGQHDNSRLEKTIAKIIDLENEINRDIDSLVEIKKEITETIKNVRNEKYRTILEMRYLNFFSWEKIAVQLHHDIRHIHRLHGLALKEINLK